ncbi:MAG TPA: O-antigen ligase family protein [Vicinamibacterales bacterium]
MPLVERLSKTLAAASVLLIVLLLLAFHPDLTPALRMVTIAAIVMGAAVSRHLQSRAFVCWVVCAMLAPAILRALTAREGPVLDLFWMGGVSASLLRFSSWSRWKLPAPWRVLAAGWALTLALAWPVLLARETAFSTRLLTDEAAINSWGMLSAPQVAAWLLFVVWTQLLGLLWLDWACERFEERPDAVVPVAHGIWIGATLASLVAVYQGTVDLKFLSTPFWASLARATGTLLDANALGMCAALAGPIAFLAMRVTRRLDPTRYTDEGVINKIAFLAFVVNLAGLWMSGSRAAMLCGGVAAATFLAGVWSSMDAHARRKLPWAAAVAAALVVIIVGASSTIGPARRLAEIPASPRSGLSAIFSRGPYGQIANQMIREHPIVGVGIGSYQILSPDYWRQEADATLPFDNAQNWWRHQLSELGVLGSAILFIWSAVLAWYVATARSRNEHRLEATIVRGLLIALGISSFIQVPTQTPIVMLTFMLLVAWATWLMPFPARVAGRTIPTWAWVAALLLAVTYAGGQLVLAGGPLAVTERARRAQRQYAVGIYPPEVMEGHEFNWTKGDAKFIWPAKTRWLVLRVWAQHPDMATEPVHVTLTSPCGVLVDEALKTPTPISVGVTLPDGQRTLEAHLHVSRTWRPSEHGSNDERDLGAGIMAEFVEDQALAVAQNRVVSLRACRPGI